MILRFSFLMVLLCIEFRQTVAPAPNSLGDIYNYVDDESSSCAVVLQRTYSKSSPAPLYGGFFDTFSRRKKRQDYYSSGGSHDVCITYEDVNAAIRQAKRRIGYRHPRAVDNTLEPMPADIDTVATLTLEVTRNLAQRYHLSSDEITNALPLIDTSKTELWHVCPAFVKPIPCSVERFRTYTGHCNNLQHTNWGAQNTFFTRFLPPAYTNGIDSPRASVVDGSPLPLARVVSTYVHPDMDFPSHDLSILFMSWSQFIDHDLTLAAPVRDKYGNDFNCCGIPKELQHQNCLTLDIPRDDPFFSKTGQTCMEFKRVLAGLRPNCALGPRGHINMLTSQLDANFVYGSNEQRARLLRTFQGGQLRVWDRFKHVGLKPILPPQNQDNPDRDCIARPRELFCFLAGDDRANLQIHLPVLHILYLREHNRIAEQLAHINPHWDDERIYQETRHISGAVSQHITYNEFVPLILGEELTHQHNLTLQKYGYWNGYDPKVHLGLSTQFQVASFRFGHTFIHNLIFRYNKHHELIDTQQLRFLMRQPWILYQPGVIDELIGGLVDSPAQEHDVFLSHEVSNHLFQDPRQLFGLDLPATNILRGREMGIPGYNDFREWCGLPRAHTFNDLAPWLSNGTAYKYSQLYKHVDDIDLWSGGISEYRLRGSRVGPVFSCLIARQFSTVRRGDRFWYENSGYPSSFTPEQLHEIRKSTQAKILCQNADDFPTIQTWAMRLPHPIYNPRVRCVDLPDIDLTYWREDTTHGGYEFRKK